MGAAASLRSIYSDAGKWFRNYFDTDMYRKDFDMIDKDHDGGISYNELLRWIKSKVETEGGSWAVFLINLEVIQFAHVQSSKTFKKHTTVLKKKVVGLDDFRNFLVHFFAISVLWIHFKNADDYQNSEDFGNLSLSMSEFKLAMKTLTESHARETIPEEQIIADFRKMDYDNSGSLGFVEVCAYCCRFIDPQFNPTETEVENICETEAMLSPELLALQEKEEENAAIAAAELLNKNYLLAVAGKEGEEVNISSLILEELNGSRDTKAANQFSTVDARNRAALDAIQDEIAKNKAIAKFVEVKYATETAMNELMLMT